MSKHSDADANKAVGVNQESGADAETGGSETAHGRHGTGKIVRRVITAFVLILVAIAVFRIVADRLSPPEIAEATPVSVRTAVAAVTDLTANSLLTGRIEAVDEVSLIPKIAGEVTGVYVELGDKVSKGKVLFELSKSQIATGLNQARIALNDARTSFDRISTLYGEGAVSLQAYEQARSAYSMARESYAAAGDAYANTRVTAPIDGYVTSLNVVVGGIASQAMPAVTVSNIDSLQIKTSLSENLINKVVVGDVVDVLVKSVSAEAFQGRVTALSPAPETGTLTYAIIIALDAGADSALKPGMFAEVAIISDRAENALAIPSKAVMIKSGRQLVVTLDADNRPIFNEITSGLDTGEWVEIRSGLSAGDRVVIEGQTYLNESSAVKIAE